MTNLLIVMVKEPRPGRVKTRLGRDIGMTRAAWWFRHQTGSLLRRLGTDPRWQTVIAVSPDREGLQSRVWPRDLPRLVQGRGSLGDRMARLIRRGPPGRIVVIGADIPDISRWDVASAFAALGSSQAVIGPSEDGGYWLIGLKRGAAPVPAKLFDGVRWSSPHAMSDTVRSLGTSRIAYLRTLRDVDTVQDLSR